MRQLKNSRFSRVLAEYLKNGSTDFHNTYVSFRQVHIEIFEIKRLKIDHLSWFWPSTPPLIGYHDNNE